MKSQTHYQVKTQTTGQVENKNRQYLPHRWQGNTLVPVIIALAISAIATVAFLTQGANLTAKNKVVIAQNEIASAISDWVVSREATGGTSAATSAPVPPNSTDANIFGYNVVYGTVGTNIAASASGSGGPFDVAIGANTRYLAFRTDGTTSCSTLATRFTTNVDGVADTFCINNANPETSGVAVGEYLLITLD
jgi:hypothetical protein